MTRKGDHIPKENRGEWTGWKDPPHNQGREDEPRWRSSTDPGEGRIAVRTNTSRSPQRQPEEEELHEDQKQTQPR